MRRGVGEIPGFKLEDSSCDLWIEILLFEETSWKGTRSTRETCDMSMEGGVAWSKTGGMNTFSSIRAMSHKEQGLTRYLLCLSRWLAGLSDGQLQA